MAATIPLTVKVTHNLKVGSHHENVVMTSDTITVNGQTFDLDDKYRCGSCEWKGEVYVYDKKTLEFFEDR